jgi:hypothetical protein
MILDKWPTQMPNVSPESGDTLTPEHDKTVILRLVFCWGGTFKLLHLVSIQ